MHGQHSTLWLLLLLVVLCCQISDKIPPWNAFMLIQSYELCINVSIFQFNLFVKHTSNVFLYVFEDFGTGAIIRIQWNLITSYANVNFRLSLWARHIMYQFVNLVLSIRCPSLNTNPTVGHSLVFMCLCKCIIYL